MGNEKILVGSDGKEVARKTPSFVTKELWYKQNENDGVTKRQKLHGQNYAAKRDPYATYNVAMVNSVGSNFKRKNTSLSLADTTEPIIDEYSKVIAVSSKRERGDVAHYLDDVPRLNFDDKTGSCATLHEHTLFGDSAHNSEASEMRVLDLSGTELKSQADDIRGGDTQKGHKTVFGSFFYDGKWGYKCCKSLEFDSHCSEI